LPHLKNTAPAVMVVTGWFDAEDLSGSFKTYRLLRRLNPGVKNVLVVGPWVHGGWASTEGDGLGAVTFGSKTGPHYRAEIEFHFEKYLRGTDVAAPAEATVFETGSNQWRTFSHWPPAEAKPSRLRLQAGGRLQLESADGKLLSGAREKAEQSPGNSVFDQYISDPARPVPYTEEITNRMTNEYMTDDQRFARRRPDVLVYQTDVLAEDAVIAGPLMARFFASTSGTDADFVVKLIGRVS
jgi:putative CocE/NonD family hydrolase